MQLGSSQHVVHAVARIRFEFVAIVRFLTRDAVFRPRHGVERRGCLLHGRVVQCAEFADDEAIESAQVSPVEIEEVERRATLYRLVENLPAEQKRVVLLRFVEQKSIKEVASEIRKTEGAVKQLQFRALSTLKARMEGANA